MPTVIYGIDGANNKVETLTKEQILDAIAQAQQGGSVLDYDDAFISKIKEINHNNQLQFWIGTQAEYNAIQTPENNVLYIISDDTSKEDILAAINNLAESVAGFNMALSAKQNVLTFDSAPTQNSENPVTSGGIYNAINNTEIGTVIYDATESGAGDTLYEGDTLALSQSIANFDYIDIQTSISFMENNVPTYVQSGTKRFKIADNNVFAFSHADAEYRGANDFLTAIMQVKISISGTTVTVQDACSVYFVPFASASLYVKHTESQNVSRRQMFYKIIGYKLP